jgi:hypothetical protein
MPDEARPIFRHDVLVWAQTLDARLRGGVPICLRGEINPVYIADNAPERPGGVCTS